MATRKKENTPANLSFEKKLVPSDAFMYGTTWSDRKDNWDPLCVREKTVRGTKDHGKAKEKDRMKLNMEATQPNIHTVDHCSLKRIHDTLVVDFTMKVLPGMWEPIACSAPSLRGKIVNAIESHTDGIRELARRYAINLANGRFLWRNRVGASEVEIIVQVLNRDQTVRREFTFDAYDYPIDNFDVKGDAEISDLTQEIFDALTSKSGFALLNITGYVLLGKAQDVYPSQELVHERKNLTDKEGTKSKVLYSEDNVAGMHSQKIGNAIRTIDTWYEGDGCAAPLAISPYGSDTKNAVAYRTPKSKMDYYHILDKVIDGDETTDLELNFLGAMHCRGGVLGRSMK